MKLGATIFFVPLSGQVRGRTIFRGGGAAETGLGGAEQQRGAESLRGHVRRLRPVSQGALINFDRLVGWGGVVWCGVV